jgi:hypothetical protein
MSTFSTSGSNANENKTIKEYRVSDVLMEFSCRDSKERFTIGELSRAMTDRVFGIMMVFFALPNLIPLPVPGISAFLGIPLVLLSLQLALGRNTPWLPHWIEKKSLSYKDLHGILSFTMPSLVRLECLLKPRLTCLLHPSLKKILASVCFVMAIMITLPIPFGNWLPALSVFLLSLAILEHDGVFVILGLVMTCISLIWLSSVFIGLIMIVFYFIEQFVTSA